MLQSYLYDSPKQLLLYKSRTTTTSRIFRSTFRSDASVINGTGYSIGVIIHGIYVRELNKAVRQYEYPVNISEKKINEKSIYSNKYVQVTGTERRNGVETARGSHVARYKFQK